MRFVATAPYSKWPSSDQIQAGDTPDLAQAIHNYFAYRLDATERRLRLYFRDGRQVPPLTGTPAATGQPAN